MRNVASNALKWLYCLTLASSILPYMVGMSGWVGMTVGNASPMIGMLLFLIAIIAAYGWRISVVVRQRGTLDAFVTSKALLILRRLGIFMMAVGLAGSLALLFVKALTLALLGKPGDAGIGYYVVSLGLYFIGSAGMAGLGIFEMSRLFGFESTQRGEAVQPRIKGSVNK